MAKILNGPLVASVSGKLGPVVFRQTFFGQVVQSKAKGRKPTTSSELANISSFRRAAKTAPVFFDYTWNYLREAMSYRGLVPGAAVTGAIKRAADSGVVTYLPVGTDRQEVSVGPPSEGPFHWLLPVTWKSTGPWDEKTAYAFTWEDHPIPKGGFSWNAETVTLPFEKSILTPPFLIAFHHLLLPAPPPWLDQPAFWDIWPGVSFFLYPP